jgi:hypothetical protein
MAKLYVTEAAKEATTSHCIRGGIGLCRGIFLSVCTDYRGVIRQRFGLPAPKGRW